MSNWVRYAKLVSSDFYDTQSGVTHAEDERREGMTLCGVRIGKHIDRGGPWEPDYHPVSCKNCLRKQAAQRGW